VTRCGDEGLIRSRACKYLLGRRVTFSDYSFYDPAGHAHLLKIMEVASKILAGEAVADPGGASRVVAPDDDYWMLEWDDSVGIPGGDVPVTARNAHAYVQRKAHHDMVGSVLAELEAIKEGLHDVVRLSRGALPFTLWRPRVSAPYGRASFAMSASSRPAPAADQCVGRSRRTTCTS
jgi:hypothetical protein